MAEALNVIRASDLPDYESLSRPVNQPPMTLLEIISMEPRIAEILITLKKPKRDFYKRLKQYYEANDRLSNLVGWNAERYELRTSQAYDVIMGIVLDKFNL